MKRRQDTIEVETLIIGEGQVGIAMGAQLGVKSSAAKPATANVLFTPGDRRGDGSRDVQLVAICG
jgi:hypothetical protein